MFFFLLKKKKDRQRKGEGKMEKRKEDKGT